MSLGRLQTPHTPIDYWVATEDTLQVESHILLCADQCADQLAVPIVRDRWHIENWNRLRQFGVTVTIYFSKVHTPCQHLLSICHCAARDSSILRIPVCVKVNRRRWFFRQKGCNIGLRQGSHRVSPS